jgi:protein-disulfide isomerase/type II secretory pathway component PulC
MLRRLRSRALVFTAAASLVSLAGGCGESRSEAGDAPQTLTAPAPPPQERPGASAARLGADRIALAEVDEGLRLKLFDLKETAHRLRRARLIVLLAERLAPGAPDPELVVRAAVASGDVEILLTPPERPRVALDLSGAEMRGATDAPVTIAVFCDYESVHCGRLQPTLRSLAEAYGDRIRFAHLDLPMAFHRSATAAAEAARCAGEQEDGFWAFHDGLYLDPQALDRERFEGLAASLGLDVAAFARCLDDGRASRAVARNASLARRIGVGRVPVSFVNGLYLKGPADVHAFRELIDAELESAGLDAPERDDAVDPRAERTSLPLELVGTVTRSDPRLSSATLTSELWPAARVLSPGDSVMRGAELASVEQRRVYLRNARGEFEYLPLGGAPDRTQAEIPALRRPGSSEATGVLHLSREAVDHALANRDELEEHLEEGRLDLEGKRLLKLSSVEPGSLYDALGLVKGDVIVQVDGVFVHNQYNPLWEALRTKPEVAVTVIRRGIPRTFEVHID